MILVVSDREEETPEAEVGGVGGQVIRPTNHMGQITKSLS
jgi:hypothetical protein